MINVIRVKDLRLVRKGDLFIRNQSEAISHDGHEVQVPEAYPVREVGEVKIGRKNVTVWDTEGKEFIYAPMDQKVAVLAEEKTEDEAKAERDERVRKHLLEELESGLRNNDPVALFEKLRDGRDQYTGFIFNVMDNLMVAQARFDIYRSINALYTEEGRPSQGDILDSFARVLASELEPTRSSGRALSRSTSVTSNLAQDVRREVALSIFDDWMTGDLKARVYDYWARRNG